MIRIFLENCWKIAVNYCRLNIFKLKMKGNMYRRFFLLLLFLLNLWWRSKKLLWNFKFYSNNNISIRCREWHQKFYPKVGASNRFDLWIIPDKRTSFPPPTGRLITNVSTTFRPEGIASWLSRARFRYNWVYVGRKRFHPIDFSDRSSPRLIFFFHRSTPWFIAPPISILARSITCNISFESREIPYFLLTS